MPIATSVAAPAPIDVMPLPAEIRAVSGRLAVTKNFSVAVTGHTDARLSAAIARALRHCEERTGLTFGRTADGLFARADDPARASLVVACAGPAADLPQLGEDESYTLDISAERAVLRAPMLLGALRGLETLGQLLQGDADGWFLPAVAIRDRPRFPWRGLLIDVCRHWQPIEVIKRNLDAMALVKLNVLHLHLTEDQGFRVESKKFPRLHELGSDGNYFTQDEIREIVAYAAERGIRVVPEFDIPGHAASWVVGHPELASAPGPYVLVRTWGVFDSTLDPTNEAVYTFLDTFLGEMVSLFPDPYLHIGGDENNGAQWSANPRIQAFIHEHGLHDNHGLQAYFNRRLQEILARHGRKLVGWDEILHPDLPKTAIIQSWRGAQGLADATRAGHTVLLSNGYYIDLSEPTSKHYLNDPLPVDTPLAPEEQARVLGGEATMWSEWVSPETIDSRIWPRTAAIAERLWSPRDVTDVDDMYRRLGYVSRRLAEAGSRHEANREPMLRRYAGDRATEESLAALRELVALVEPVKGYQRGREQPETTQFTPLTGLADCATPDSQPSREFAKQVETVVFGDAEAASLAPWFAEWGRLAGRVRSAAAACGPREGELMALADQLSEASQAAGEALAMLASQTETADLAWREAMFACLDRAGTPRAAVELPLVAPVRLLVAAAIEKTRRGTMPPDAWRAHLPAIAFPKKPE
ncbi:MAG TPA: family 20 glycosylhydrolase [Opitutaceae bacterium]